mmetsp:Transcript_9989/g.22963  ORF Transcript_9989/g.22963 Transcript_9989/m.22963 type:complete len:220 (-) Transcript_9989:267-926(-)
MRRLGRRLGGPKDGRGVSRAQACAGGARAKGVGFLSLVPRRRRRRRRRRRMRRPTAPSIGAEERRRVEGAFAFVDGPGDRRLHLRAHLPELRQLKLRSGEVGLGVGGLAGALVSVPLGRRPPSPRRLLLRRHQVGALLRAHGRRGRRGQGGGAGCAGLARISVVGQEVAPQGHFRVLALDALEVLQGGRLGLHPQIHHARHVLGADGVALLLLFQVLRR